MLISPQEEHVLSVISCNFMCMRTLLLPLGVYIYRTYLSSISVEDAAKGRRQSMAVSTQLLRPASFMLNGCADRTIFFQTTHRNQWRNLVIRSGYTFPVSSLAWTAAAIIRQAESYVPSKRSIIHPSAAISVQKYLFSTSSRSSPSSVVTMSHIVVAITTLGIAFKPHKLMDMWRFCKIDWSIRLSVIPCK